MVRAKFRIIKTTVLALLLLSGCKSSPPPQQASTPASENHASATPVGAIIRATPNPVPAGFGKGKATISWSTGDGSLGEVWVSINGEPEILFAGKSPQGSAEASWIDIGGTYEFRLYQGTEHKQVLTSVKVERSKNPIITAVPNPVPAGSGKGQTTISWSTGDGSLAEVWVSINGEPEILFAGKSTQGSAEATWIDMGGTYEFRLYKGTEHKQVLTSVKVTRDSQVTLAPAHHDIPLATGNSGANTLSGPQITAIPNPVPAGAGTGRTTISWNTGDASPAEVWVSINGEPEILFAGKSSGGVGEVPWIADENIYEFRLYAGTEHTNLLSSVNVVRGSVGSSLSLSLYVFSVFSFLVLFILTLLTASYLYNGTGGQHDLSSFAFSALNKFRWPLYVLIATAVFVVANHILLRRIGIAVSDAERQFHPFFTLVADYARAGQLVYWDPLTNAGLPQSSNPEFGAFSPLNLIVGFLVGGGTFGFILYWLLMWWLGGLGIFMLARHLKAPSWGGCVVALGYLFCGLYTGQAQHTSHVIPFSFLPLVIWRLDSALCLRKLRPAVEAGALWGLSALAGYPGMIIITGCFCTLWVIGKQLFTKSFIADTSLDTEDSITLPKRRLIFAFSTLALMVLVGSLVLLPTYFAFFHEGAGITTRTGAISRERVLLENALHPGALSTFAGPYLSVLKLRNWETLWPYTGVDMSSIYSGAVVTVLALFALLWKPRNGWRWWLTALGTLSLACALGQTLPLRGWLYDWFYPMRFFRHAAIFRDYYIFSISVLALLATRDIADAFQSGSDRIWKHFLVAAVLVALAALTVITVSNRLVVISYGKGISLGYTHAVLLWVGICCTALIAWQIPNRYKKWFVPALLLILAGTDALLTSVISRATIINTTSESIEHWRDLDSKHSTSLDFTRTGLQREENSCAGEKPCDFEDYDLRNEQMITKIPVFNSYGPFINDFHREMVNRPLLKSMAIGNERFWFSKNVAQVTTTQPALEAFIKRAEVIGASPLVIHSSDELLGRVDKNKLNGIDDHSLEAISKLSAMEKAPIELIKYAPEELVFNVQCPTEGWLLVTDRWARSWQADVNGKQTPVYPANFIFRAIKVQPGRNEVRFTYHPMGLPWLIALSWGTLGVILVSGIYARLPKRKYVMDSSRNEKLPSIDKSVLGRPI